MHTFSEIKRYNLPRLNRWYNNRERWDLVDVIEIIDQLREMNYKGVVNIELNAALPGAVKIIETLKFDCGYDSSVDIIDMAEGKPLSKTNTAVICVPRSGTTRTQAMLGYRKYGKDGPDTMAVFVGTFIHTVHAPMSRVAVMVKSGILSQLVFLSDVSFSQTESGDFVINRLGQCFLPLPEEPTTNKD